MDQNIILTVWSITLKKILKRQCHFWVPWTIYFKMHALVFENVFITLRKHTQQANFKLGPGAVPH